MPLVGSRLELLFSRRHHLRPEILPNSQPDFSILKESRRVRVLIQREISLFLAIPVAVVAIVLQKRLDLIVKFSLDNFSRVLGSQGNSSRQGDRGDDMQKR